MMSCDMSHDLAAPPPALGVVLVGQQPIPCWELSSQFSHLCVKSHTTMSRDLSRWEKGWRKEGLGRRQEGKGQRETRL